MPVFLILYKCVCCVSREGRAVDAYSLTVRDEMNVCEQAQQQFFLSVPSEQACSTVSFHPDLTPLFVFYRCGSESVSYFLRIVNKYVLFNHGEIVKNMLRNGKP
jgi:hypothetical protein